MSAGLALVAARDLEHEAQNFVRDLAEVAEAHPTPDLLSLLGEAYPFQPCAHCRDRLVRLLGDRGALPPWLREEAALDASEDLRKLRE